MATSVLSGLFSKDAPDSPLVKALANMLQYDDTPLFLKFKSVVVRAASQELFHRWGENDALSARLWRNLHRVIRQDERVVVFPVDKPEWVTLTNIADFRANETPLSHDELVRIINEQGAHYGNLTDLVHAILLQVARTAGLQKPVQVEILFSALRETTSEIKAQQLANEVPRNRDDPLLSVAIDRATDQAFQNVEIKLARYQDTGKLHPDVVEVFRLALSDLVADCADGGPAQSYYEYLHVHKPSLTLEDYRQTLRTRFEYLAESVQKGFIEAMRKQYL